MVEEKEEEADKESGGEETVDKIFKDSGGGDKSPEPEGKEGDEESIEGKTLKEVLEGLGKDSGLLEPEGRGKDEISEYKDIKREVESVSGKAGVGGGAPAGIILKEGEIEIPADSTIHLVKKDGRIAVVVGKGGGGEIEVGGEVIDLDEITESGGISVGGIEKSEVDKILRSMEDNTLTQAAWVDEGDVEGFVGGVKEDIDLLDLRKEFKEEDEEEDEEDFEEEDERSLLDRIKGMVRKTTEESRDEKLMRLTIENLEKTRGMKDERKAVVGVACVLKAFLEIKFEIPRELTYIELIQEVRTMEMDNKLRSSLIRFFKGTSIMMYANIAGVANYNLAFNLARKTVEELS